MTETINIALAADSNYVQHVAVVIASVMKNTAARNVCFYLLSDGIDEDKKEKIQTTASSFGAQVEIIELSGLSLFDDLFTSGHISKAAYFRLDIANLVSASVKKIIYTDVDLVVRGDIEELWSFDMQGKPLAAVPDLGIMSSTRLMKQKHDILGIKTEDNYFNSGVLIIDVEAWRKGEYAKSVIELAASGDLPHHDQDALNKVFYGKWQELPISWNVIPPVYNLFFKLLKSSKFRDKALKAKRDMRIMHFAGRYKPWEFAKQTCFNNEYYDYLSLTAFKDASMPQPGRNMKGKSLTRALWRLKLADFWNSIL
ncbi:MAG: glycosyltransferase family 8 protein [Phascolarctobacterium sp.]|nr:glycosyltransferase family 8 protein [Phascolarctobacterium sp.]